jgi:outer membrane protein TolC
MKKVILVIFICINIIQSSAKSEELKIWDYKRDDFVEESLLGKEPLFEKQKQKIIDTELEKLLNVKLVPITLEKCLRTAVEYNYTIKEKTSTESKYKWEKANAYMKFLPNAIYNFSIQKLSGTYLVGNIVPLQANEVPIQNYFTISWSVFNKGQTFFEVSEKKNLYKSAQLLKNFSREEVILNTATYYYQLLKNKAEVGIYKTNLIDRKAQYDLTIARYTVGTGTKFDVYRAEAELANAKQSYITAFNILRVSQAKLANIMGIDITCPLYPEAITVKEKNLVKYDLPYLIDCGKKSRKDLMAEEKRIEALKAARSSIYTEFIPDINVNYSYAIYGTVKSGLYPSNSITLTLSESLGQNLGAGTITRAKASTEEIKAAIYALTQKRRDVELSIITSNQNTLSAKEKVSSSKIEVFSAGKSLENSIKLMNAGGVTFIDVIQAQGIKVNAQVKLAENITDYNIAQIQLLFDSGLISIEGILNDEDNQTP